jgi:hypothetical protein
MRAFQAVHLARRSPRAHDRCPPPPVRFGSAAVFTHASSEASGVASASLAPRLASGLVKPSPRSAAMMSSAGWGVTRPRRAMARLRRRNGTGVSLARRRAVSACEFIRTGADNLTSPQHGPAIERQRLGPQRARAPPAAERSPAGSGTPRPPAVRQPVASVRCGARTQAVVTLRRPSARYSRTSGTRAPRGRLRYAGRLVLRHVQPSRAVAEHARVPSAQIVPAVIDHGDEGDALGDAGLLLQVDGVQLPQGVCG